MAYKYEKVDQKLLVPQIEDQLMIYIQQEQIPDCPVNINYQKSLE